MRSMTCFGMGMVMLCGRVHADRPFEVDDAGVVPTGSFESEFGSASWKDRAEFGVGLKHGLTPRMDFGVSVGYAAIPSADRAFSPVAVSAKWVLVPELLAGTFTTTPGSSAWSLNGIASKSLGDFGANLNLGGDFAEGERNADLSWGVNPFLNVGPATIGAELLGDVEGAQQWKLGTQLHAFDGLAFDLAAGSTLDDDAVWTITAGIRGAFGTPEGRE